MSIPSRRVRFSPSYSIVEGDSSFKKFVSSFKSIVYGVFFQVRKKVKVHRPQKTPIFRSGSGVVKKLEEKEINNDESSQFYLTLYNVKSNSKEDIEEKSNLPVENGKETQVTILLILIDNFNMCFEILKLRFNPSKSIVQRVSDKIPLLATIDSLRTQRYEYLSTPDGIRLDNDKLVSDYFTPDKDKYSVLIAIPYGSCIKQFEDYIPLILEQNKIKNVINSTPNCCLSQNKENVFDIRIDYDEDSIVETNAEVDEGKENVFNGPEDTEAVLTSDATNLLKSNEEKEEIIETSLVAGLSTVSRKIDQLQDELEFLKVSLLDPSKLNQDFDVSRFLNASEPNQDDGVKLGDDHGEENVSKIYNEKEKISETSSTLLVESKEVKHKFIRSNSTRNSQIDMFDSNQNHCNDYHNLIAYYHAHGARVVPFCSFRDGHPEADFDLVRI